MSWTLRSEGGWRAIMMLSCFVVAREIFAAMPSLHPRAAPRAARNRSARRRTASARTATARPASGRTASARNANARSTGPRNAGPRNARARNASPRNPRARNASPRNAGSVRAGHSNLALEVLGKLREVFRAAKLNLTSVTRSSGVTGTELWALAELQRQPGLRVSELAVLLSLRQSTVSNLVERLDQARMLRRRRNDPDGRVVRLYLTAAGEKAVRRAPYPPRGALSYALEGLSAAELRRLHGQLDAVLARMAPAKRAARNA